MKKENEIDPGPHIGRKDLNASCFPCCPASLTTDGVGWNGFRCNSYKTLPIGSRGHSIWTNVKAFNLKNVKAPVVKEKPTAGGGGVWANLQWLLCNVDKRKNANQTLPNPAKFPTLYVNSITPYRNEILHSSGGIKISLRHLISISSMRQTHNTDKNLCLFDRTRIWYRCWVAEFWMPITQG